MRENADGMKYAAVTNGRAPSKGSAGDVKHHHVRRYARAAAAQTADRDADKDRAMVVPRRPW
jgi:hypothetical protein